jgi:hypothetical protein
MLLGGAASGNISLFRMWAASETSKRHLQRSSNVGPVRYWSVPDQYLTSHRERITALASDILYLARVRRCGRSHELWGHQLLHG